MLTEQYARLFTEEFRRETARIAAAASQPDKVTAERLSVVSREIENLAANMLTGVLSLTLVKLLSEREVKRARLKATIADQTPSNPAAVIVPQPDQFEQPQDFLSPKLWAALNGESVRSEAADIL